MYEISCPVCKSKDIKNIIIPDRWCASGKRIFICQNCTAKFTFNEWLTSKHWYTVRVDFFNKDDDWRWLKNKW